MNKFLNEYWPIALIIILLVVSVMLWTVPARAENGFTCDSFSGSVPAGQVCFEWTANPEPLGGYKLYANERANLVCDVDKSWTSVCVLPPDVQSYNYFLTAWNDAGESGNSDVVATWVAPKDPGAPEDTRPITVEGFFKFEIK